MGAVVVLLVGCAAMFAASALGERDERERIWSWFGRVVTRGRSRLALVRESWGASSVRRTVRPGREGALVRRLRQREEERERERMRARCLDELGELIDVVALCMSSGVSFDAALETYCARYKTELADLLAEAMASWRMGLATRREALGGIAQKLSIPAFTTFVETVTESLEFGAPMVQALSAQAKAVRDARRMDVEERMQKAPVKLLIPTSVLILPALILAILGPMLAPLSQVGA